MIFEKTKTKMGTPKTLKTCFLLWVFAAGLSAASSGSPPTVLPPADTINLSQHHGHHHHHHRHLEQTPTTNCVTPPPSPPPPSPPPPPPSPSPPPPTDCGTPPPPPPTDCGTPPPSPASPPPLPPSSPSPPPPSPTLPPPPPNVYGDPTPPPPYEYHFYPPPTPITTPPSTCTPPSPITPSPSPAPANPPSISPGPIEPPSISPSPIDPPPHDKPKTPRAQTPPTPSTPSLPNIPFFGGTCDFWKKHPHLISNLFNWWWNTFGRAMGGLGTIPGLGPKMNFYDAISNTRTDGIGALYREGTAALMNSMVNTNYPFTISGVIDSFITGLASNEAASAQAHRFKLANEGRIQAPRV